MDADTTATVTEPTTEITEPDPAPAPDWSALADLGDPDTIRKQLAHAREWEKRAKANVEAAKKLEALQAERMTDSEKSIAEAEKRGRAAAMAEMNRQVAEAKLRAAATGKVADVDALVELVDVGRLVTDEGVDDAGIAAVIERFTKVVPAQPAPPKFGSVELGPQGDRPRQLGEADLARMTPEQIVEARSKGQLDDLLGVTS